MASPNALLVLGLLLAALLYGSSSGEALAGEQATVNKAGHQHSAVAAAGGGNGAVKYYANNEGAAAAAEAASTASEGEGNNDGGIGTDGFCNCCSYFRRRCARLCCADGRQIPV